MAGFELSQELGQVSGLLLVGLGAGFLVGFEQGSQLAVGGFDGFGLDVGISLDKGIEGGKGLVTIAVRFIQLASGRGLFLPLLGSLIGAKRTLELDQLTCQEQFLVVCLGKG